MNRSVLAIALFLLILPSLAPAHKLAPALLQIDALSSTDYAVLWRTGLTPSTLQPRWPADCTSSGPSLSRSASALEQRIQLTCPQGLEDQLIRVDGLVAARNLVLLRLNRPDGASLQQVLSAEQDSFRIPSGQNPAAVWRQYLGLGVRHILQGVDHLLLVLGLYLLAVRWRALLVLVTAFTVGHSLTLALVSLEWIHVPGAAVEFSIALTILLMALGLIRQPVPLRGRWPLIAVFGLIHGLGFAGALGEIGLPADALLPALLSFNLGIELGQLLFLLLLSLVFAGATRVHAAANAGLRLAGIYLMGSLAVYWCLDRGWAWLS